MTPEILTLIAQRNRALDYLREALTATDPDTVKALVASAIAILVSTTSPAPPAP